MSFEVKKQDLLGRIGRIVTKSGIIETPALLPVVNPKSLEIHPKNFGKFNYNALITNAYILKKHFEKDVVKLGVHRFLKFNGVIMTDSGAYQILRYGKVSIAPREIVQFQKDIKTDIGVILDIPTGWKVSREYAEWTVKETLKRARDAVNIIGETDILWTGPVQGGTYLDLVRKSALKMGKLPFQMYALGSPTKIMQQYLFGILIEMILTAKLNLPIEKPFHLFGAGHPMMFALAVASGCDLFDSASYALYARDGRYLTETGTERIEDLEYFPCACPVCRNSTPKELKEKNYAEKTTLLMQHNLYTCKTEIERIKQYISEQRLWELIEQRSRSHPQMLKGFRTLCKYSKHLIDGTPAYKSRGIFIFDETSLSRPEVLRYKQKLKENHRTPKEKKKLLLLLPEPLCKPFHTSPQYKKIEKIIASKPGIHVCFYSIPFGVIPLELDDVYPLSQYESCSPFNSEMKKELADSITTYIKNKKYNKKIIYPDYSLLDKKNLRSLRQEAIIIRVGTSELWSDKSLQRLREILLQ